MDIHVLNGDALAFKHSFEGNVVICRECLIDGPVKSDNIDNFWQARADFIYNQFGADRDEYRTRVKPEFEKLSQIGRDDNIYLWFEHDLFCQVNMWFIIHLLSSHAFVPNVFRVMPPVNDNWLGFGRKSSAELAEFFKSRVRLSSADQALAGQLWKAYQAGDTGKLLELGNTRSDAFPHLKEVCEAQAERVRDSHSGRPYQRLRDIINSGTTNFGEIFRQFSQTERIYGFGDDQVKTMLKRL
jgi:hypothetical protein